MILLEGPDRCGKSSLARVLLKALPGHSYRHHVVPPVDPYRYFGWFLADSRPRVIVDRMHWSEYVYGRAYRRGSELSHHQWRILELMALAQNTTVVLMTDTLESIASRYSAAETFPLEGIQNVIDGYETMYNNTLSHLPRVRLRLHELESEDKGELEHLIWCEEVDAALAEQFFAPSLGAGSLKPEFVVVAEAPRDLQDGDSVGCPLSGGPASEFFWKVMDEIGAPWWEGYYINQSSFNDFALLGEYLNRLSPKRIVTLGGHAATAVTQSRFVCESIYNLEHPSYVRRFMRNKHSAWAHDLAVATGAKL